MTASSSGKTAAERPARPTPSPVSSPKKDFELSQNELVEKYDRLAYKLALPRAAGKVEAADLLQEARLGLMRAAQKWSPSGGANFLTYATYWINAFVFRFITRQTSIVHRLQNPGERAFDFSLNVVLDDENGETSQDRLVSEDETADVSVERADFSAAVRARLIRHQMLRNPLTKDIIELRLMRQERGGRGKHLHGTALTLDELAERHGLSRKRVRQVEMQVIVKLRDWLREFNGVSPRLEEAS